VKLTKPAKARMARSRIWPETLTMAKDYINPPSLFESVEHGFSQAVAASGKRTLYVSGQTAWDAGKQLVGGTDLAAQAKQAFRNVRTAVEAGGGTLADVVSLRLYIVDYRPDKAEAVGVALKESFAGPAKPAATWIGVASLADPGFLIEIEATAVLE
jgi:enamine deaminase RidA (YjgF/YER057c/UK114 family)